MSKNAFIIVSVGALMGLTSCFGGSDTEAASPSGDSGADSATPDGGAGDAGAAGEAGSGGQGGSSGAGGAAGSGGTGGCEPNAVEPCTCPGGSQGTHTCDSQGTGFGLCVCPDGGTGGSGNVCNPGQQVSCPCVGSGQGVQVCAEDGKSYGACTGCPNGGAGGQGGSGGSSGSAGSSGSSGSGGSGGGTKNVTFAYTLPSNVPSLKGVTLTGVIYDPALNQYQYLNGSPGTMASWCDSNSPTPAEVMVQSGLTFTCTRALPVGKVAVVNLLVEATGGYVFPSNGANIWACYGVGTSCSNASCWQQYGSLTANGQSITIGGGYGAGNGQQGCNLAFSY